MGDLIRRSILLEELEKQCPDWKSNSVGCIVKSAINDCIKIVKRQSVVESVPLNEVYRLIAGHCNYHGDDILAALTCVAEGKEMKPIRPIETALVAHGEWIHDISNLYGCSECMNRETMSPKKLKNFCPNCGAKMNKQN